MRATLMIIAAAAAIACTVPQARAFDAASCERYREHDNDALAETMRAASGAPAAARECFLRIAMLRMGELTDAQFAEVPLDVLTRKLASHGFEVPPGEPVPDVVLRRYADDLASAEPAAAVDPVALDALEFHATDRDDLSAWDGVRRRGPAVASTAGAFAAPRPEPEPQDPAAPQDAEPPVLVAAAPASEPWRAEEGLGTIPGRAHLPRNTPPPHPRAAERALAFAAAKRLRREHGCVDPGTVDDGDVARNRPVIDRAGLCVTVDAVREGAVRFVFTSIHNPRAPNGPVWYLPHDNEQEAFDAAVHAVAEYGGRMVAVNGDETRFYLAVDPNRHFAMTAADAAPCRIRRATPQYTRYVMDLFDGQRHILSIHNNTRGGGVSVNVWNAKTRGFKAQNGPFTDPDHLVYIAGRQPVDEDVEAESEMQRLTASGLNVVHETVTRRNSDCSFSNHVVLNDGRPYYNIEAVHGSLLQKRMVDTLMGLLGYHAVTGG